MWESLATSRRSDRVLHGAAKLLNVVVGVIALPLWLLGQRLRDPFRRLLSRLDADPAPLPVAQPRERSMGALMADLESIPHHLHHSDGAMVRKGLADISSFVLAQQRETANLGYAYPAQFSDHVLEGADGEHIAAHGRPPGGSGKARFDRRPRAVLLTPLRLRASDRGQGLLRVGLQRARPRPAELRADQPDQPSADDGGLEGGRGRDRRGALSETARSDHGGSDRDLAGRLGGPRCLPPRGGGGGAGRRHPRRLPTSGRQGDGKATVAAPSPLTRRMPSIAASGRC